MKKTPVSKTACKIGTLLIVLLFGALVGSFKRFGGAKTFAEETGKVEIKIFWTNGCPHCAKEKKFLEKLATVDENIVVKGYEVSQNTENLLILRNYGEKFSANISGVPFTVIGETEYLSGFRSDETTGLVIVNKKTLLRISMKLHRNKKIME